MSNTDPLCSCLRFTYFYVIVLLVETVLFISPTPPRYSQFGSTMRPSSPTLA